MRCLVLLSLQFIVGVMGSGTDGAGAATSLRLTRDYFSFVLDTNGDGFLDEVEATQALSQHWPSFHSDPHQLFENGDTNTDGRLDIEETRAVLMLLMAVPNRSDPAMPYRSASLASLRSALSLRRGNADGPQGEIFRLLDAKNYCGNCSAAGAGVASVTCNPPAPPGGSVPLGSIMTIVCQPGYFPKMGATHTCNTDTGIWDPPQSLLSFCTACNVTACSAYSSGCTCATCNPGYFGWNGACMIKSFYSPASGCFGQTCGPIAPEALSLPWVSPYTLDYSVAQCQDQCTSRPNCTMMEAADTGPPQMCFLYNYPSPCQSGSCLPCSGQWYCQYSYQNPQFISCTETRYFKKIPCALTSCAPGSWVDLDACGYLNSGCSLCSTVCPAGSGINVAGGSPCIATADRVCQPCPANQFNAGDSLNCQPCTQCSAGSGQNVAGGSACSGTANDGVCVSCVSQVNYNSGVSYVCTPCSTTCPVGTGIGRSIGGYCTPTSDRYCHTCPPNYYNTDGGLYCEQG